MYLIPFTCIWLFKHFYTLDTEYFVFCIKLTVCKMPSICIKSNFSISITYVYSPYNKKKITRWLKDMNFIFSC